MKQMKILIGGQSAPPDGSVLLDYNAGDKTAVSTP